MPIISYDSLDAIPEGLKEFAKPDETTGKVTVNVVASVKLDEFRTKNIELSKQIEQAGPVLARVKEMVGDDFDAFERDVEGLRQISKRVQDGELKTNDQIEQAVKDRIDAVKSGYEENAAALRRQVKEVNEKALTFEQRLHRNQIDGEVTKAVIHPDSGVRPEALPDILSRAYSLFKIEDGKPVPKQGEATIYGADGASPMSASEWIIKLRDEAPHYFRGNFGGGASGGKDGDRYGGMSKTDYDKLTPMQKLTIANSKK